MRKTLKVLAAVIGLIVLLLGIAAGLLPLVIDPNQFKSQLAQVVKEKTGRDIEFAGALHVSVFPWLGISSGRIQMQGVQGFDGGEFLRIEQGEIKVKVWPLLAKRLEISRVELKGLRLNLIRNQDGANNWELAEAKNEMNAEPMAPGKKTQVAPVSPEKPWLIFAAGGLVLEEASIHWDDRQAGKHFDIDNISVNVGKFTPDQFADVALSLAIAEPASGYRDHVDLKTRVLIRRDFEQAKLADTALKWARDGEHVPGKALSAILAAPEILFEKESQKIRIDSLRVQSGELSITSSLSVSHLFAEVDAEGHLEMAEFNPGTLLKRFDIVLPKFQDSSALSRLQAGFDWHVTQNTLSLDALRCKLDDTLLQGEARIEGWEAPAIRFNFAVDTLDVGRYLPNNKTPQVTPSAALAGALSKLPVRELRKLDVQGEVNARHLMLHDITADGLRLQLSAKNGVVQTRQTISGLNRGGYAGSVSVNTAGKDTVMALSEKVEHVDIVPFLKTTGSKIGISGALTGAAAVQGRGHDLKQIRQRLKGKLAFVLKDGEIRDLQFQNIIEQALGVLDHAPVPPALRKGIDFSEISGTAALADSVIENQDLLVKSSRFRIAGGGSTNIETGRVDYRFVAHLIKAPATETAPEKWHSTPIVVTMAGTLADPDYRLDMAALLTEKNKAKIEKLLDKNKGKIGKLKDKLDKKLGPGVGDLLRQLF